MTNRKQIPPKTQNDAIMDDWLARKMRGGPPPKSLASKFWIVLGCSVAAVVVVSWLAVKTVESAIGILGDAASGPDTGQGNAPGQYGYGRTAADTMEQQAKIRFFESRS